MLFLNLNKSRAPANDLPVIVSNAENAYGVMDAQAKVDTLKNLIDKWAGIVKEASGDRDAIIVRLKKDVFDKLPADYGMDQGLGRRSVIEPMPFTVGCS